MVPIGLSLVPLGSEQRLDGGWRQTLTVVRLVYYKVRSVLQELELTLVLAEPTAHVVGHAVHVQLTVTMGQYGLGTIITGNDDKTALGIENVVGRLLGMAGINLGVNQLHSTWRVALELMV